MTKTIVKHILKQGFRILSWVLYLLTLVTAYGGYFNPDWWTLPAIGVLFFPYFAMATLVVSAVWLFARKFIIGSIGIGVLMACGPTFSAALPLRFENSPGNKSRTFKMVTYNCLHLTDLQNPDAKLNRSLHFLIHSGADFICLQELYDFKNPTLYAKYPAQIDSLLKIYPYYSTDNKREVEFASKYPFEQLTVKLPDGLKYGSVTAYRLEIDRQPLTVVNVHLSSYQLSEQERNIITEAKSKQGLKASLREFEGSVYQKMKSAFSMRAKVSKAVAEYADSLPGNVIICGDFNDVPGSWTYRNFTKRGFEDAYAQTGFGHLITYNEHLMYFHIDQILYKGDLVPLRVKKERINTSDHYPLLAEFEFM